jgi:hypothetical protein
MDAASLSVNVAPETQVRVRAARHFAYEIAL